MSTIINAFASEAIWKGVTLAAMARIVRSDGTTVLVAADIDTITRTIGVLVSGCWVIGTPETLIIATVISTLSTANGWTTDTTGYNFRDVIPATSLATAGLTEIEYIVTLTDGTVSILVVTVPVNAIFV